jgi:hypothetical protein
LWHRSLERAEINMSGAGQAAPQQRLQIVHAGIQLRRPSLNIGLLPRHVILAPLAFGRLGRRDGRPLLPLASRF